MLWTLTFDRLGVAIGDLYFVDPAIDQGDDGAERGVRLELRLFEREPLKGGVYSAVPIKVDRPVWRVDLLETADSPPGSLNRAHHHPRFTGWDPMNRVFDERLSADPVAWVREQFDDIGAVLDRSGLDRGEFCDGDIAALQADAPMITAQVELMLAEVAAGRAGLAPSECDGFVRTGWL